MILRIIDIGFQVTNYWNRVPFFVTRSVVKENVRSGLLAVLRAMEFTDHRCHMESPCWNRRQAKPFGNTLVLYRNGLYQLRVSTREPTIIGDISWVSDFRRTYNNIVR